jgi:hypothetical protein
MKKVAKYVICISAFKIIVEVIRGKNAVKREAQSLKRILIFGGAVKLLKKDVKY